MRSYRIFETAQFQEDMRTIARSGESAVLRKLRAAVYPQLCERPHYGPNIRKLKHWSPETWRYRVGSWRFFYEIDDEGRVVLMTAASHRSSAY